MKTAGSTCRSKSRLAAASSGGKSLRRFSYVRVMAHNTISIKQTPTPRATTRSRGPLAQDGPSARRIVSRAPELGLTAEWDHIRTASPALDGLRFQETGFSRPETQLPIGGPNNCCAVSETKRKHRIPPIRGLFTRL